MNHSLLNDDDIRIEKRENGRDVYIFDPYNPLNKEITQERPSDSNKSNNREQKTTFDRRIEAKKDRNNGKT